MEQRKWKKPRIIITVLIIITGIVIVFLSIIYVFYLVPLNIWTSRVCLYCSVARSPCVKSEVPSQAIGRHGMGHSSASSDDMKNVFNIQPQLLFLWKCGNENITRLV